ncbi:MAG: tRNA 5-methylaminomethyl-2-thiouridine biosynthesis bifunctional protein [Methylophilaceae bacterium]
MQDSSLKSQKIKAIVVGGGIAGCSTAYALVKRGIAVTLIERHTAIAQEASGNPVSMLYPKFSAGTNILSTIASHGFTFTLALLKALNSQQSNDHNVLFQLCGQIQLAFNQREQQKQQQLLDSTQQHTFLQLLSATEASQRANIALPSGGLYLPESGWVKPMLFCEALLKPTFNSVPITRLVSTEAIEIQYGADWTVSLANKQSMSADIIVLCNANELLQFEHCKNIPITPVRGQVNFFKVSAASQSIQPVICSDHYLSPAVDGMHSIGTSYTPNDLNPALSAEDTRSNLQALKKISLSLFDRLDLSEVAGRVAWRSATRDYIPLAGQLIDEAALRKSSPRYNDKPRDLPWIKGLYVNAGHGSKGMITAPLCGELIASLIADEPLPLASSIASQLNPSRFLLRDTGLKQMAQHLYDV